MIKINTDHLKELAETMDLIAQHQLDKASQIYYCVVKSVSGNQCTIVFNNKQYTVPYYGGKPTPNKTYAIFLPHNNMNESFVIGDGKDGGTEGKIVPISEGGTGADNAADARTNLGLGSVATENVVPLNKGGTGANNAADARTNLAVLPLAGGTLTGQVTNTYADKSIIARHGTANKDTGFQAERTDTGVSAFFGVGSGGVNHGIFSNKLGKWLIYGDSSNVYCNGTATNVTGTVAIGHGGTGATTAATARANLGAVDKSGDTMTGNLTVQKQDEVNIYADNTKSGQAHKVSLCAGSSGIGGIWDATLSKWLIGLDRSGSFYCADRVSQSRGELTGLVSNGQMWLCIGMRYSAAESIVVLAHMYSGAMYTNTIYKTTNMTVVTNNQGTVSLRYDGNPASVLTCAIRLY